jgi:hypothetical protein
MLQRIRFGLALLLFPTAVAIAIEGCDASVDEDDAADGACVAGTPEAVTAYGPRPRDPDEVLLAGVFIGSCIPDDGVTNWTDELYQSPGDGDDGEGRFDVACLAAQTDGCAGVDRCLGIHIALDGPCETRCEDGLLEGCDDSLHFTQCCGSLGMQCSADGDACVPDAGAAACTSDHEATCVDGHPLTCLNGHLTPGADCAAWGLECGISPLSGEAACVGSGPACSEGSASSYSLPFENGLGCSGDTLRICAGGQEHELDCASMAAGFSCQEAGGTFFCGLASECAPSVKDESCDGATLRFCHAGKLEAVDCTALGFTGCGLSGSDAVCTPNGFSPPS